MNLFIHTFARLDNQITLQSFTPELLKRTYLVVQAREEEKWFRNSRIPTGVTLLVLPDKIKTLSPTRHYILEWAVRHNIKKVCMMDDDLTFFYRPDKKSSKLLKSEPQHVEAMFKEIEKLLTDYVHVGVGQKEYSNTVLTEYATCRAMLRILAYKPKPVLDAGCRFDRMVVRQELDMTLQLLRKGFPNIVTYNYLQIHKISNAPGGCSTYRTTELVIEQIKKFCEFHKGFVRLGKHKKRRGMVKDVEAWPTVNIAWKKAYESSLKNKLFTSKVN